MGANDPESAVVALKRAADLSRNTDGLFNINQVEFIDALIDAYAATGRYAEAEKESLYAMRVEEAAYGRSSIKLLDRLDKLARWYEGDRRYTSERNVYERSLAILQKGAPRERPAQRRPAARHRALLPARDLLRRRRRRHRRHVQRRQQWRAGVRRRHAAAARREHADRGARHHRLQHAGRPAAARRSAHGSRRLVPDLQRAAPRLRHLRGRVEGASRRSNNTKYLEAPRILAYRPSISSIDRSQLDPAEAVLKSGGTAFQGGSRRTHRRRHLAHHRRARRDRARTRWPSMKRSRYAPRIENGAAVPTEDVVFVERVLVRVTPQPAPARGAIWEGGGEGAGGAEAGGVSRRAGAAGGRTGDAAGDRSSSRRDHRRIVDRHRLDGHLRPRRPTASAEPGSGCTVRLQRLRGQQRLGHIEPRELREEFRRGVAHRRVRRDPQLFLAVADLGRRSAAVAGERQRVDQLAVRRVDARSGSGWSPRSTRRRFPWRWRTRTARCAARRWPAGRARGAPRRRCRTASRR